jgi:deoxyribodipyrimidine photo-lyase
MSGHMSGEHPTTKNNHRTIVWFRGTDLRLHDNEVVSRAVESIRRNKTADVVPVFCYDPRWFCESKFRSGSVKTGPYRAQFLMESVQNLKENLLRIGSDLIVASGPPEDHIPKLVPQGWSCTVYAQKEVTSEEIAAEKAVKNALPRFSSLELVWGSTLYHVDDLNFDVYHAMPTVFTPFRQKVENGATVRQTLPSPANGDLGRIPGDVPVPLPPTTIEQLPASIPLQTPARDPRSAFTLPGGEAAALGRLKYYLFDSHLVSKYFEIRNGMLGSDYSTKLAPALAHGCISPRFIYESIQTYEKQHISNKSTYWVIFELVWRDYFKFYALSQGNSIFYRDGPAGKHRAWDTDREKFQRWKDGKTGWPLVDANMRELAATGFMSNRGRQNVASFLCLDLNLDWRLGADYFETMLLDYDVASNWGNWVAAAGLTGGRVNKFNIVKQSKDYDKEGEYIRHWVPELGNVPAEKIHDMKLSIKDQEVFSVRLGENYPVPIKSVFKYADPGEKKNAVRFGKGNSKGQNGKKKTKARRPKLHEFEH